MRGINLMKYERINILKDNAELDKLADDIAQQLEKEGIEELLITIDKRFWEPTDRKEIVFSFILNEVHGMALMYDEMIEEDISTLVNTLIVHMGN